MSDWIAASFGIARYREDNLELIKGWTRGCWGIDGRPRGTLQAFHLTHLPTGRHAGWSYERPVTEAWAHALDGIADFSTATFDSVNTPEMKVKLIGAILSAGLIRNGDQFLFKDRATI